jgi:hypothetical protein
LLWQGTVSNSSSNVSKIVKSNYYFWDQGLLFLVLQHSLKYQALAVDRGSIQGLLAENFVALNIREFTIPASLSVKGGEIDFLIKHKAKLSEKPIAIEVKFSEGETRTADRELKAGHISHIIKIQGKSGDSSRDVTVCLLKDADTIGSLMGYDAKNNRYSVETLDLFNDPLLD